jgi:hypothetical protein
MKRKLTEAEFDIATYRKAQNIAFRVMGKTKLGSRYSIDEANIDPLAHHLLSEIIYIGTLPRVTLKQ